jgi:general secretion pathway protein A
MYREYFRLREEPFNITPDPRFLYLTAQHREALNHLLYGIRERKGFIALTGEVGTGKTTMLECLQDFLATHRIDFAFLFNSRISVEQFFEMIAYDLDLKCNRTSKTEVLFALNQLLLENTNQGRTTVLIIDEAHNLEWDVLEEVRLLGNLENRREKLLQIVMAGQPEFDRKLDAPSFRQLKQRIALRCSLRPFHEGETFEYIHTRLARAGMTIQTVFPPELLAEIHTRSQGIPRVINALCDNLLLTAFALESRVASLDMLDEVTDDMRLEWPGKRVAVARARLRDRSAAESPFFSPGD